MTLAFLLTSLIVVASPGTGVLYTLAVALTRGARPSVAAAFGCTLGIVPQMLAAMLGLAAVLHTSALAFAALKWCGVAYLLYMAWQALRETGALAIDPHPAADARSSRSVIVTAILINILIRNCRSSFSPSCRSSSAPRKVIRWRGCWSFPARSWR